jgi:hypothetical protein
MSVQRNAGAVLLAFALFAAGTVLFARSLGYAVPVWSGIAMYWPVLLVVWGLLKAIEYYGFRRATERRDLFPGAEVALLIIVIVAGTALTTAANISASVGALFRIEDLDLWDITGNSYQYEERQVADVPPGSSFEILNRYGNIDIQPAASDRVILEVKKTVRASSREEADARSREFTFSIKNAGRHYRIISNRDEARLERRQVFKSSLTIQVPRMSDLQIDNWNGRVTIEGLTGTQHIVNRFGPVVVRGNSGALTIENRNGDVLLELPASAGFRLDARTAVGSVHSEFDGIRISSNGQDGSLSGQANQGGPDIRVTNRNGDIRLNKAGAL